MNVYSSVFVTAKKWRKFKCLSSDEQIEDV